MLLPRPSPPRPDESGRRVAPIPEPRSDDDGNGVVKLRFVGENPPEPSLAEDRPRPPLLKVLLPAPPYFRLLAVPISVADPPRAVEPSRAPPIRDDAVEGVNREPPKNDDPEDKSPGKGGVKKVVKLAWQREHQIPKE